MTTQIRQSVFETNSSSCHSLVLGEDFGAEIGPLDTVSGGTYLLRPFRDEDLPTEDTVFLTGWQEKAGYVLSLKVGFGKLDYHPDLMQLLGQDDRHAVTRYLLKGKDILNEASSIVKYYPPTGFSTAVEVLDKLVRTIKDYVGYEEVLFDYFAEDYYPLGFVETLGVPIRDLDGWTQEELASFLFGSSKIEILY